MQVENRLQKLLNMSRRETSDRTLGASTLIVIILLLVVILAVFGIGVDSAIGQYLRTTFQSSLDAATQSALSQGDNDSTKGTIMLTKEGVHNYIINNYDTNRSGNDKSPMLVCQTETVDSDNSLASTLANYTLVEPDSGCGWRESAYSFKNNGGSSYTVSITIHEVSKTAFMGFIGINYLNYTITSEAKISVAASDS